GALEAQPGADERVAANAQWPAGGAIVKGAYAIRIDRVRVLIGPGRRIGMEHHDSAGHRPAIIDVGCQIPFGRELQLVAGAVLRQAERIAIRELQILGIEQPTTYAERQLLYGCVLYLQLNTANAGLAGVVGRKAQTDQLADLHVLVFGIEDRAIQ